MRNFIRFVKIEHSLFSLPVVFAGSFLAVSNGGAESMTPSRFFWILIAVLGARSAGFGLNRIADRAIDGENPRTRDREIPSGKISPAQAWAFVLVSSAVFMGAAGMLSKTCLALSPIPLVLFAIYPFLKRFTLWSHLGLGLAWGIAPLGGWLALRPAILPVREMAPAILLSLFCVFWIAGFDVIYALLDEEFDRRSGLHSMPAVMGAKNAIRASEVLHAISFMLLGTLVQLYLNQTLPFVLLGVAGLLLIVSHWRIAVEPLTPPLIDFAFFKVNAALGFVIFFIVVLR